MTAIKPGKKNYRQRFEEIANLNDNEIHLDEAALVIAAETDPEFDIDYFIRSLDKLASKFETSFGNSSALGITAIGLINFIHKAEGFSGNVRDYKDPDNSYLNRVLETRCGIPISLALIHIALGERLNIPVKGIKYPLRFLVKYGEDPNLIVDPFTGRILSEPDCANLLKQLVNPKAVLEQHYFDTATNKDILTRILENLKQIFWEKKSWDSSQACIERQIILRPEHEEFSLQLGAVYERQGKLPLAKLTYTNLLQRSDDENLRHLVSKQLLSMQGSNPTIH